MTRRISRKSEEIFAQKGETTGLGAELPPLKNKEQAIFYGSEKAQKAKNA